MTMENPFSKIRQAKERSDSRKIEGARNPGTLNPKGRGGPIFDSMKESFDVLGTREEDNEKVQSIRNLFEGKLYRHALDIYNKHLQGKKGSPSHADFELQVESSYKRGFDLYLKVALRLDAKDAPDPHSPYRAMVSGSGHRTIHDEYTKEDYVREFIEKGNNIDLLRSNENHNFKPDEDFKGYADKYQQTSGKGSEKSAMEAYMFEKLRLFSNEFFEMLDETLRRGVPYKNAIELAEYVYGNDASVFEEMGEKGLDSNVVAWQSIANRARVRVPLETYLEIGPKLESEYPYKPGMGSWVSSPQLIRNLIFKYPHTAEQGLAIVERELPRLKELFPQVPQKLIVSKCVFAPGRYEEEIKDMVDQTRLIMQEYPMHSEYGTTDAEGENVFSHFNVEGSLMSLLDRVSIGKVRKEIEQVLQSFAHVVEKIKRNDIDVSYNAKRRMLKSLLSYNASPEKILKREQHKGERIHAQRFNDYKKLVTKAEALDPIWGEYYVDIGFGDTDEEIISNGKAATELIVEHYGADDGEEYLSRTLDMYAHYFYAGFSHDKEDLDALKDALIMDQYNTKVFYERTLKRVWPVGIDEIRPKDLELI